MVPADRKYEHIYIKFFPLAQQIHTPKSSHHLALCQIAVASSSSLFPPQPIPNHPAPILPTLNTSQVPAGLQLPSSKTSKRPTKFLKRFKIGAVGSASRPVGFGGLLLQADDFRHPVDKQNTSFFKSVPGLFQCAKALIGSVSEQLATVVQDTSIRVSEHQFAELYQLLQETAKVLNIEAPDLYVHQNPEPNAYTLAINDEKPFIIVHTSLVERLSSEELQAVLAHELGHLKCDHGMLTLASILVLGACNFPVIGFLARSWEEKMCRWEHAAEFTGDRASLLVVQDPKVVISYLMKLEGDPSLADPINVDAFLQQARSYDKDSSSPIGGYTRNEQKAPSSHDSHPPLILRAREIDDWAKSPEYKSLLRRAIRRDV